MERLFCRGVRNEFLVDAGADVGIVYGVNPEYLAAWSYGLAARNTLTALSRRGSA